MVEAVKEAFPHVKVLARAYDRRHAYELLNAGADEVERETYESALNFGRSALERLGVSERRALKAAILFRDHDQKLFEKIRPAYGEEDGFVNAARASRETFERLIRAEMERLAIEDDEEDDGAETPRRVEAGGRRV
jgi:glutathione-regulated potassium-efflux system ancillary protein KefC/glutathione-regulated potassium-efflux system protein KefB